MDLKWRFSILISFFFYVFFHFYFNTWFNKNKNKRIGKIAWFGFCEWVDFWFYPRVISIGFGLDYKLQDMLWFLYWVSFKTAKRIPMILFHLCRLLIIVMSLDHKFVKVIIGSFYYEYLWYPKFVKLINEVLMRSHMVNIWFVHLNNKSQIISFKHKYALLLCIIWTW